MVHGRLAGNLVATAKSGPVDCSEILSMWLMFKLTSPPRRQIAMRLTVNDNELFPDVPTSSDGHTGMPTGARRLVRVTRRLPKILVGLLILLGVPTVATARQLPTLEWAWHKTADGMHPNGEEQALMWLMNRGRENPTAEGIFLATSSEPDVQGGRDFFEVDLSVLQNEFSLIPPMPPAAFDSRLYQAALAHSNDLIARDAQDHEGQLDRIDAAGFQWLQARLNVFSFAENGLNAHAGFNIDWGPGDGTGMQPGRGHRQAIMSADGDYTNVGLAAVPELNSSTEVGPLVVTGNYCMAQANGVDHFNRFVVGTVWKDLDGDGSYDPGEGYAGVTVMPDHGQFFAVTAAGGGYAIPISAAGSYELTFSGGALVGSTTLGASVGADSVLLDYVVGSTPVTQATIELNAESFGVGQAVTATFMLKQSITQPFTAFAAIFLPGGTVLDVLTFADISSDPLIIPAAANIPSLDAPFAFPLLEAVEVPPGAPPDTYEIVVSFFDPATLDDQTVLDDAFLEASKTFTIQ